MENGYCLIKKLFDPQKIFKLQNDMEIIFENFSDTGICGNSDPFLIKLFKEDFDAFLGCAHLCQKLFGVYSLTGSNEVFHALMNECNMDFPVINTKPLVSFSSSLTAKSDAHWKIGPHQDWPSNLGSTNGVTCWIPLVDVDDDLGPLEVVPNSHILGQLPHEGTPPILKDYENLNFTPIPMEVGDALFFNTMLIHRSGMNKTNDRIRWSLHLRYSDASDKSFIERKYPRNRTND